MRSLGKKRHQRPLTWKSAFGAGRVFRRVSLEPLNKEIVIVSGDGESKKLIIRIITITITNTMRI
jgi:hypothetical protein